MDQVGRLDVFSRGHEFMWKCNFCFDSKSIAYDPEVASKCFGENARNFPEVIKFRENAAFVPRLWFWLEFLRDPKSFNSSYFRAQNWVMCLTQDEQLLWTGYLQILTLWTLEQSWRNLYVPVLLESSAFRLESTWVSLHLWQMTCLDSWRPWTMSRSTCKRGYQFNRHSI